MTGGSRIARLLARHGGYTRVLPMDLEANGVAVLDFTDLNPDLDSIDPADVKRFNDYVIGVLRERRAAVGIGRYGEDRGIYRHSDLFAGEKERRSIHLGIDLFVSAGTAVHAPLPATVHSFADNEGVGNYGPTIILEHELEGVPFWTLWGHLSREALAGCRKGVEVPAGSPIGTIGDTHENGGWPPHLHFQIIADIGEWEGDFPGVASPSERERFLDLCPDPDLILEIPGL